MREIKINMHVKVKDRTACMLSLESLTSRDSQCCGVRMESRKSITS